jgi:hypothetical protein
LRETALQAVEITTILAFAFSLTRKGELLYKKYCKGQPGAAPVGTPASPGRVCGSWVGWAPSMGKGLHFAGRSEVSCLSCVFVVERLTEFRRGQKERPSLAVKF